MRACDALLIVQDESEKAWARHQLEAFLKLRGERPKPIGLYLGPSAAAGDDSRELEGPHVIDCRAGMDETRIREFFSSMLEGARP